jgi:hypothetical protein
MNIITLSGKSVNIEGLEMTEKEFISFFEIQSPWRAMQPKDRKEALKKDFKTYRKCKQPKGKKEESPI